MTAIENQWWFKLLRRFSLLLAFKSALVIVLAYYAGFYFSTHFRLILPTLGGLWCAVSGIVVLQVFIHESFDAAGLRILGSLIGATTGYLFTLFMNYSIAMLAICVFVTVMVTSLFKIKETFRLASLTATIIIVIGMMNPNVSPLVNAISRFAESAIGAFIAILITAIFFPLRKKWHLLNK